METIAQIYIAIVSFIETHFIVTIILMVIALCLVIMIGRLIKEIKTKIRNSNQQEIVGNDQSDWKFTVTTILSLRWSDFQPYKEKSRILHGGTDVKT